jgi:hypothetical protein
MEVPMLKWLMRRKLTAFERLNGYDAAYLHEVLDTDADAFLKFARATAMNQYRKDVPLHVYFAATLTASMHADCGPCTQLGVGFALKSGVDAALIAAVIAGNLDALPEDAALAVRFARAVLAHAAEVDAHREQLVRRFGPRAVLALSFGIMAAQLYPTLKYALGHGKACTRVEVAGRAITPARLAAEAA